MTAGRSGTVMFGDVVDSRHDPGAAVWLRTSCALLDAAYGRSRLAPFGFTQGDELQGLLARDADPFPAVLRLGLRPDARELRWAIVSGAVEPGSGPATQRTGPAFLVARDVIERARTRRAGLVAISGDEEADELLANLGPLLPALLADLTPRQREVASLLLIDDLRRSEAADRLAVSRPTVSVIADRARVRHLAGLTEALGAIFARGVERAARASGGAALGRPA